MARSVVLATAIAASLLAVSGAGGTAAQTPKRGGTVVIAWGGPEFPCLNFLVSPCKEAILPTYGVVEGAFEEGPDNSWQPKLVSHVDVTTKPPFTLTYFIRPEARWSDGVPVTASDFVFTYRARLKYPLQEDDDPYRTRIRSVRALDAKTVRVTLRMRFAFWHQLFSEILPFHALRGENLARIWVDRIDNPRTGRPIGSGPFLVQSWERGRQLTLMRNPAYWGSHRSYLDRIVVRFFAGGPLDPGVVDLFGTNRNAVGQWQFSEPLVTGLDGVPGVTLRFAADAPGWEHLDIRSGKGGHPALRNKLVRRALAYGIDRVAIVRALFGDGRAEAATSGQRGASQRRSLLCAELERLSLRPRARPPPAQRSGLSSGRGRHLLLCRSTTLTPLRVEGCRRPPGADARARPGRAQAGRCRGCPSLLVSARPGARERGLRRHALRVVRRWRRGWGDQFSLRLWG